MENWKQAIYREQICHGYEVSDLGRVRSFRKRIHRPGGGTIAVIGVTPYYLKSIRKNSGYNCVSLSVGGKIKQVRISLLVLETFVGVRPLGFDCCHGPLGSYCDFLSNVCWGSKSKNHGEDRLRDGSDIRGEKQGQSKFTNLQVVEIRRRLACGEKGVLLAREYGVAVTTISMIKCRKNWSWLEESCQD